MKIVKIHPLGILVIVLLFISSYQTYALASLTGQLNQNGISFGKSKANYSFSTNTNDLGELPDMAGGC
jgi:hypothetical protein